MPSAAPVEPWRGPSWKTRLVVLGVVAIAVGVLGLTGGLDRVPAPPPATTPTVPVNQDIDAGPWRAKVTNAAATKDLDPYKPRTEGNWLLAIVVQIEVTAPDSQPDYRFLDAVTLPGLTGLVKPEPLVRALVRDGSAVAYLNPGLPERVAFIFEMAAATPVPKQVAVVIKGRTAYLSWTTRRYTWTDTRPMAQVTVDVADKTATP